MPPGSLGWCSTKRDINGIHVNGPAGNPWVCTNSICHRLFAIIFKMTTFEITKNLIFIQVFIAFHEFMNSDLAHLFLFSKFSLISYTSSISSALSSPRAESARAFTGRRNSNSGRGEDFLSRQPNFFTETAVTPERKVEKSFPRWEINRHAKG